MMEADSIESKRHEIWTRMYELLDLNPGSAVAGKRGRVLTAVRPTVAVEPLLRQPDVRTATAELDVGFVTFHTVPDNEQWLVYAMNAALAAGDRDVGSISVFEPFRLGGAGMQIFTQTPAASLVTYFPVPVPMSAGWRMGVTGEGGTTDGDWNVVLLVERWPSWLT